MEESVRELTSIRALLSRVHGKPLRELHLERRPLRGGLEASSIARVSARYRDALCHRRVFTLVVKRLAGAAAREAMVYERLVTPYAEGLSPRVLASEQPWLLEWVDTGVDVAILVGFAARKLPSSKGHVASIPVGSVEG